MILLINKQKNKLSSCDQSLFKYSLHNNIKNDKGVLTYYAKKNYGQSIFGHKSQLQWFYIAWYFTEWKLELWSSIVDLSSKIIWRIQHGNTTEKLNSWSRYKAIASLKRKVLQKFWELLFATKQKDFFLSLCLHAAWMSHCLFE